MLYNLQTLSHITHLMCTYGQKVGIFYFSFDRKEKQASDGLSDLPKVTQLVVQSLGFMPSSSSSRISYSFHYVMLPIAGKRDLCKHMHRNVELVLLNR